MFTVDVKQQCNNATSVEHHSVSRCCLDSTPRREPEMEELIVDVEKTRFSYLSQVNMWLIQLLQLCTARTAWSDSVTRSASVRLGN